jgi:hypothetical protein
VNSRLRNKAIDALVGMVRDEVIAQQKEAGTMIVPPVLLKVIVPKWLHDAIQSVEGGAPMVLGTPVQVGEHEEIHAVWKDITSA